MVAACIKEHADTAASEENRIGGLLTSAEAAYVRADEEGLRTILNNLVDNAVKYTPNGGRVTVQWRVDAENVTLEVQDTGIGIAKQHHARVFERFYRVDKARSRELGRGTGCRAFDRQAPGTIVWRERGDRQPVARRERFSRHAPSYKLDAIFWVFSPSATEDSSFERLPLDAARKGYFFSICQI